MAIMQTSRNQSLMVLLFLTASCLIQIGLPRTVLAQQMGSTSSSSQTSSVDDGPTSTSSLFNSPARPKLFQLPELPSIRFPSLPGFSMLKEAASSSYASTKRTSRQFWNRTKEILRPYDPIDPNLGNDGYSKEPTVQRSSWLWWMAPQSDENEIETVNDFLRQERPKL